MQKIHQPTSARHVVLERVDERPGWRQRPLQGIVQAGDAAGRKARQHLARQREATLDGNVLQHDVGMHEIEGAADLRKPIVGQDEVCIGDAGVDAIFAGFRDHGFGNVDADNLLIALGQRQGQAPDATAEIERAARRHLAVAQSDLVHGEVDLAAAGREETLAIFRNALGLEFLEGNDAEIGIDLAPFAPVAVGYERHVASKRRLACDVGGRWRHGQRKPKTMDKVNR